MRERYHKEGWDMNELEAYLEENWDALVHQFGVEFVHKVSGPPTPYERFFYPNHD